MDNERLYYQALARFDKIGPTRLRTLLKTFPNVETIWSAPAPELRAAGLDENIAQEFTAWRTNQNLEKQWAELEREKIKVLTWNDPEYSALLKEIHDLPHTLFVRIGESNTECPAGHSVLNVDFPAGHLVLRNNSTDTNNTECPAGHSVLRSDFTLAVVGTRMATNYGRQIVEQVVRPLARAGLTIVSGLALGIDALAHLATLNEQGTTIAVLGGGCDTNTIYPSSNRALAERIIANGGAVISEYPPGALAMPYHFPHRNRIISGLSRGTLVIEATEDSGSLITARHALEQNREVFAVPGDIARDTSKGVNNLLKMGAHPVLEYQDVLQALDLQDLKNTVKAKEILPDDPIEEQILKHLNQEPAHIDELIEKTEFDPGKISSYLTLMEMKGKVRHIGGMNYMLAH